MTGSRTWGSGASLQSPSFRSEPDSLTRRRHRSARGLLEQRFPLGSDHTTSYYHLLLSPSQFAMGRLDVPSYTDAARHYERTVLFT